MALSDSSVIDRLCELFEDTNKNLYRPLNTENTVLSDHLTDTIRKDIEELKIHETENERRIAVVNKTATRSVNALSLRVNELYSDVIERLSDTSVLLDSKISDVSYGIHTEINALDDKIDDVSNNIHTELNILNNKIDDVSIDTHTEINALNDKIEDVSVRVSRDILDVSVQIGNVFDTVENHLEIERVRINSLESSVGEISETVNSVLQWEDKDGSILS